MHTECQLRDAELCARIHRLIDEGALPVFLADTIDAGYGSGLKCHGCDQPVIRSDIECVVVNTKDPTALFRLHLGCFVLWQIECVKRMRNLHPDHPDDQNTRPKHESLQ
jgi:hypothetical protein